MNDHSDLVDLWLAQHVKSAQDSRPEPMGSDSNLVPKDDVADFGKLNLPTSWIMSYFFIHLSILKLTASVEHSGKGRKGPGVDPGSFNSRG